MNTRKRAILRSTFNGYPVARIGHSQAVLIPKVWLDVFGVRVDGRVWVKVDVDLAGPITISGIDPAELAEILGASDERETE